MTEERQLALVTLRGLVSPLREVLPGRIEVGTRLLAQGLEGRACLGNRQRHAVF